MCVIPIRNSKESIVNIKIDSGLVFSLCEFFGEVPLLKSPSKEYDLLFREALNQLWKFITSSDDIRNIRSALQALRNFDFTNLALEHVPPILYESIKLPREYQVQIAASHSDPHNPPLTPADVVPHIPGDCWIALLQHINENAVDDAIGFVTFLIESEMSQYRSGVYMLQEGRPEPKELQHLHNRSPLRAMIKFIIEQSEDKYEVAMALKCLECVSKKFSRPIPPLNWFFLIEYVNQGSKFEGSSDDDQFKMKKFALMIASNQIAHSGSAKTIVENYLQSFDATDKDPKEIQMALELITSICDGVSPRIFANFLCSTLDFVYNLSASSHFEEKCHFELALDAISKALDKKCLVPENIDILNDEICRFHSILQSDSHVIMKFLFIFTRFLPFFVEIFQIFEKYLTFALKLPSDSLDRLTTPTEWNIDDFRKTLMMRSKATSSRKSFSNSSNPWMWLDLLIDNVSDPKDSVA